MIFEFLVPCRLTVCRGTLRSAGAAAGMLPSLQAVPAHRGRLSDADIAGELLLALHIRLRAGQHDIVVRGEQGALSVQMPGVPQSVRVDGADDNVP